ncbi:LuxR C-terminal-related transcriptional regulator [Deinococcus yavapaiensis]|uniref:Putative ATPase n=1 Tax=Deinococcus yavapaiensis KR-236 TaxID=694435 RepID=A0A318S090_9DEIO|nr:LuxR C-terminal-related transcriptional regulator [Deinococcus yavapaiensis]PYE49985.1 putative ATPase [Deinococcus yavapaiensis KR-236]
MERHASSVGSTIRAYLPPLVGRERELALARDLLARPDVRLVTLRGPGGIGKTRLALDLFERVAADFDLGAVWVDLAPLREASDVLPKIASALKSDASTAVSLADAIAETIGARGILVVLDNFEQVVDAAGDLGDVLARVPGLRVLATSRVALRLRGEHVIPIGPLELPRDDKTNRECAAVRLFVERVEAVEPQFKLTSSNCTAVEGLCEQLDGVPLALELAAARLRVVPLEGLLTWLDHQLDVLADGPRDGPHHGASLRETIAWSYDLLTEGERDVFRACGAFVGGFTLPALEAVCDRAAVRGALIRLVEHSLVQSAQGPEPRWRLLEPIREFAEELLGANEAEVMRARHATFFLRLAESSEGYGELLHPEWRARLAVEDANLHAALEWLLKARRASESARMVLALGRYWGHDMTPRRHAWLTRVRALPDLRAHPDLHARILAQLGLMATILKRFDEAREALQAALELFRAASNKESEAYTLMSLAHVYSRTGDHEHALRLAFEQEALARSMNDAQMLQTVLNVIAVLYMRLDQPALAVPYLDEGRVLCETLPYESGAAFAIGIRGWVAYLLGRPEESFSLLQEAWRRAANVPNALLRFTLLHMIAFHVRDDGQFELAAKMVGCGEAMRTRSGEPWDVCFERHARQIDEDLKVKLGAAYQAAWTLGRTLEFDEVSAEVHAWLEAHESKAARSGPRAPKREEGMLRADLAGLTMREKQVLALVAQGHPDRRIAKLLDISPTTVSKHVSNMLSKSGLRNRTELAYWATGQ